MRSTYAMTISRMPRLPPPRGRFAPAAARRQRAGRARPRIGQVSPEATTPREICCSKSSASKTTALMSFGSFFEVTKLPSTKNRDAPVRRDNSTQRRSRRTNRRRRGDDVPNRNVTSASVAICTRIVIQSRIPPDNKYSRRPDHRRLGRQPGTDPAVLGHRSSRSVEPAPVSGGSNKSGKVGQTCQIRQRKVKLGKKNGQGGCSFGGRGSEFLSSLVNWNVRILLERRAS